MVEKREGYAFDWLGGPVYRFRRMTAVPRTMPMGVADRPHIIEVVVQDEQNAGHHELRLYFALNLAQAVARAAELLTRLPELEIGVRVLGIRPGSDQEIDAFFRAMDRLEPQMPEPVEAEAFENPAVPTHGNRNGSTGRNCGQGQHPNGGGKDARTDSDGGGDRAGGKGLGAGEAGGGEVRG